METTKGKKPTLASLRKIRTEKLKSGDWSGALKTEARMRKMSNSDVKCKSSPHCSHNTNGRNMDLPCSIEFNPTK